MQNISMADWEAIFRRRGKVFDEPQEDMARVIGILKKEGARKVLDLGCGSGRHTVMLAKEGCEVYATDVSREGLRMTREWLEETGLKADVREASCFERFPFPDGFFDAVISVQVIHHSHHDKVRFCISEIERVLKPGGMVFITVSASKYKRRATRFSNPEPRVFIPLDGEEEGLAHFIYTRALLRKDMKDFRIIDLHMDQSEHYCVLGRLERKQRS
jgi:SAM-dependent methyltransferase